MVGVDRCGMPERSGRGARHGKWVHISKPGCSPDSARWVMAAGIELSWTPEEQSFFTAADGSSLAEGSKPSDGSMLDPEALHDFRLKGSRGAG